MTKRARRRILAICIVAAVILIVGGAVGGKLYYDHWHRTYLTLHGQAVRRDSTQLDLHGVTAPDLESVTQLTALQTLDLTDTGITIAQYLDLKEKLPDCAVTWSVPFQGGYQHCQSTQLTVTALTQEDMDVLVHFPQLAQVNAEGCTDRTPLLALRRQRPDLKVCYTVPISGTDYDLDTTQLVLSKTDPDELTAALPHLQQLQDVAFTGELPTNEQIIVWKEAYPNVRFYWEFELCGKKVSSQDTQLDLNNVKLESIDEIYAAMPCFYNMEKVEMCNCGISNEQMDVLVKAYPNTKFVWIVRVGRINLRTDITVFMPWKYGYGGGSFQDQHAVNLKYCTDIICMDLGHMPISDLSFLKDMTKMQYLILAEVTATDFSVLRNLKELKYLEIFLTAFDDASILAELPKLDSLNICYTHISDTRPLQTMTNLKYLWMSGLYQASWRDRTMVKEKLLGTKVVYNTYGSTEGGWREIPGYYEQRDLLGMRYMTG